MRVAFHRICQLDADASISMWHRVCNGCLPYAPPAIQNRIANDHSRQCDEEDDGGGITARANQYPNSFLLGAGADGSRVETLADLQEIQSRGVCYCYWSGNSKAMIGTNLDRLELAVIESGIDRSFMWKGKRYHLTIPEIFRLLQFVAAENFTRLPSKCIPTHAGAQQLVDGTTVGAGNAEREILADSECDSILHREDQLPKHAADPRHKVVKRYVFPQRHIQTALETADWQRRKHAATTESKSKSKKPKTEAEQTLDEKRRCHYAEVTRSMRLQSILFGCLLHSISRKQYAEAHSHLLRALRNQPDWAEIKATDGLVIEAVDALDSAFCSPPSPFGPNPDPDPLAILSNEDWEFLEEAAKALIKGLAANSRPLRITGTIPQHLMMPKEAERGRDYKLGSAPGSKSASVSASGTSAVPSTSTDAGLEDAYEAAAERVAKEPAAKRNKKNAAADVPQQDEPLSATLQFLEDMPDDEPMPEWQKTANKSMDEHDRQRPETRGQLSVIDFDPALGKGIVLFFQAKALWHRLKVRGVNRLRTHEDVLDLLRHLAKSLSTLFGGDAQKIPVREDLPPSIKASILKMNDTLLRLRFAVIGYVHDGHWQASRLMAKEYPSRAEADKESYEELKQKYAWLMKDIGRHEGLVLKVGDETSLSAALRPFRTTANQEPTPAGASGGARSGATGGGASGSVCGGARSGATGGSASGSAQSESGERCALGVHYADLVLVVDLVGAPLPKEEESKEPMEADSNLAEQQTISAAVDQGLLSVTSDVAGSGEDAQLIHIMAKAGSCAELGWAHDGQISIRACHTEQISVDLLIRFVASSLGVADAGRVTLIAGRRLRTTAKSPSKEQVTFIPTEAETEEMKHHNALQCVKARLLSFVQRIARWQRWDPFFARIQTKTLDAKGASGDYAIERRATQPDEAYREAVKLLRKKEKADYALCILTLTVLNAQESEPNLEMLLEDVIKSEKARTPLLPLRRGQLVNGEFRLDKDRTKLAVKNLMNALARGYHARQAATLVYDWGDVDRQLSPCGDIPTRKQVVDRKSHRSGRKQPIEAETTPPERWHTMKALLFSLVHITPSEAVRCEAATPYRVKRGHTPFPIFKLPTPLTDSPPSPTSTGCWGCRAAHSSTSWHSTSQELRRCRP